MRSRTCRWWSEGCRRRHSRRAARSAPSSDRRLRGSCRAATLRSTVANSERLPAVVIWSIVVPVPWLFALSLKLLISRSPACSLPVLLGTIDEPVRVHVAVRRNGRPERRRAGQRRDERGRCRRGRRCTRAGAGRARRAVGAATTRERERCGGEHGERMSRHWRGLLSVEHQRESCERCLSGCSPGETPADPIASRESTFHLQTCRP